MSKTLYGDGFIALGFARVDCGEPDKLHGIFDWAIEHGAKGVENLTSVKCSSKSSKWS